MPALLEADASRYEGVSGDQPIDWSDPRLNTRAVREYLAALDPAPNPDRKTPKVVSLPDPCSAWTAKANKRVLFGYGLNYLIDNKHAVIVDVAATPARTYDEVAARSLMGTPPYEQSRRERKKVEMLFAHLKRNLGFERLRLRGLTGAQDEFLLAATAQNLRRLAKIVGPSPPNDSLSAWAVRP